MEKMTRRKFISTTSTILAGAPLVGGMATMAGCRHTARPNILVLMVDQMQSPPRGYEDDEGAVPELKEVLGFQTLSAGNAYAKYFPGLMRLRQNSVVMRNHFTASAACVPSRASILTGQYPSVTGVTQTDGLFKYAENVSWLDPEGTPTIGHWFRAAGYSTHYFGKWHASEPEAPEYLEPWGFKDWELSIPEPHGGTADNLGTFRDVEFTDAIAGFFGQKSAEKCGQPWLAFGSLVNPHDISAYPINWQTPNQTGVVPWDPYPPATTIPEQGDVSREGGVNETNVVELNPDGFPQANSNLPRTYSESLDDKPHCQKDYSYKWGLAYGASTDYALPTGLSSPLPFQLRGEYAEEWALGYNQFYFYCQYLADLQLRKILQYLDDSGMADNTIIVFLSDHGDMTNAHGGMIQKWHNAYNETIRVPMIISSPLVNKDASVMREIEQPTSSIDLLPTLLGLAGLSQSGLRVELAEDRGTAVKTLAGADLSGHVRGRRTGTITGPDGVERPGVFFMTEDAITEEAAGLDPQDAKALRYDLFCEYVNNAIEGGIDLAPEDVRQPNTVHALCTEDWKLVRYVDPNGVEPDEWELYYEVADPVEATNLVDYQTGELRDDVSLTGLTRETLEAMYEVLKAELARQEALAFDTTA